MEPRLRASYQQFLALIEFMERHGDLSRPQQGPQGRLRGERLWQELTNLLNSIGGGVEKTLEKWKKVWADWKTKTKKKSTRIRCHSNGTGGGPHIGQTLTLLEERVISILGVAAVVGQQTIEEQGFTSALRVNTPSQSTEIPRGSIDETEIVVVVEVPTANGAPQIGSPPVPSSSQLDVQPSEQQLPLLRPQPLQTPPHQSTARASVSPHSTAATPRRRRLLRARRNRGQTPFDRAASEFVAVEQRRLRLEETRECNLHERETRQLTLESERIQLESRRLNLLQEQNQLLQQLVNVAERFLGNVPRSQS